MLPKDSPSDYTGSFAPKRVLRINFLGLHYGTDDKTQGAALLLSIFLILIILLVIILGLFTKNEGWLSSIFTWLGSAFLFTSGVAIGRTSKDDTPSRGDGEG